MSNVCEWCNEEVGKLVVYDFMDMENNICKNCQSYARNDICRTCNESLYGEITLDGECSGCKQVKAVKKEKYKSEMLNGLGLESLTQLTHSVIFNEEDYERWVTFGQGNFTPQARKAATMRWLRIKLVKENGWSNEDFDTNIEDIMTLIDGYATKIFSNTCVFMLKENGTKGLRGMNIVAERGNIRVVDNAKNIV